MYSHDSLGAIYPFPSALYEKTDSGESVECLTANVLAGTLGCLFKCLTKGKWDIGLSFGGEYYSLANCRNQGVGMGRERG